MTIDFASTKKELHGHLEQRGVAGGWTLEALKRLEQLHWLCQSIARAQEEARLIDWSQYYETPKDSTHSSIVELQTLCESFYYLAWRLIGLLKHHDPFRNLKNACPGIRMVRNQLLEHPERPDSGVTFPSFSYGSDNGPRLKVISESTNEAGGWMLVDNAAHLLDPGLWPNARELKAAIEACVSSGA